MPARHDRTPKSRAGSSPSRSGASASRSSDRDGGAPTIDPGTRLRGCVRHPRWLFDTHVALHATIAVAYGWEAAISDERASRELFVLNQSEN